MPKANKYNWVMIKDWYVRGEFDLATGQSIDYSFADVCKKWGVKNRSTVKDHADKENWNTERDAYKEQLRQTIGKKMREIQIPSIIEIKRIGINAATNILRTFISDLGAGKIQLRASDAMAALNFLLAEYRYLFDVEKPDQRVQVDINFKDKGDIYDILARIRNGNDGDDSDN